jgi:bifunctional DNA-binding transcriptional regulator/antitoxin component of YhaV-PrlF toxin-antitoxin module
MAGGTSTITSKWQITIPEDVRKVIPFKIGQRIVWEVEGDTIVGRRVRTMADLAGCLKSDAPIATDDQGSFSRAAIERHDRISKQKS